MTKSIANARIAAPEGLQMVDFVLPVTALSLVLAVILLSIPRSFLSVFGQQLAGGHVFWIVAGVASVANVATYFLSVRTKFSTRHIWTAVALLCTVWIVLFVSQGFYFPIESPSSYPLSPGAVVGQLARSYFVLVTSVFFPCPLLITLTDTFARIFEDDSENQNRPSPLPS